MSWLTFFAPDIATAALLAIAAFMVGRRLCRAVPFESTPERIAICTAVGLGTIAVAVLLIGLGGRLTRPVVLAVVAAGVLLCAAGWPREVRPLLTRPREGSPMARVVLLALVGVVLIAPLVLLPLFPPTAWDATMYHLAMPKAYVHWQRVQPTPFLRYPVFPQLNEMLFALGLLFATDLAAHLVQFLMFASSALVLYAFGRERVSARAGLWAAAMWVGTPSVVSLASTAMIDVSVALYALAACYAFARWRGTGAPAWLATAGLLAGFAAGCKYTGLFFVGALGQIGRAHV